MITATMIYMEDLHAGWWLHKRKGFYHLKPDLSNMRSERGWKLRNTSREGRYSRNRRNLLGHLTLVIDKNFNQ